MKKTMRPLVLASALALGATASADSPVVETENGRIAGTVSDQVVRFAGIPYAAAPVGELRWRAPQPGPKWQGVRSGAEFGAVCPQPTQWLADGIPRPAEDCLYLNVWTPVGAKPGAKLPVVYWIHGGGWETGSGWLPDDYARQYTREGIIFVSVNYRLGRLGTFAHPALSAADADDGLLGNYGFLDVIAGLKWVNENVTAFGGDPGNITINGTSAGGGTVNMLFASPLAKGLFARGSSQSAGVSRSALHLDKAVGKTPSAEQVGEQWAASLNAKTLKELRALPVEATLVEGPKAGGGIIVDGRIMPKSLAEMFESGDIQKLPYIAGATGYEGSVAAVYDWPAEKLFSQLGQGTADKLKSLYREWGTTDTKQMGAQLFGDLLLAAPSLYGAQQAAKTGLPTRVFFFDYVAENLRPRPGAYHGGDTYYAFNTFTRFHGLHDTVTPSALDKKVAETFHGYWINFAKHGDPNGPGLPEWPLYKNAESDVVYFAPDGVKVATHPIQARMDILIPIAMSKTSVVDIR
jgi:para-nitrobenzyl esterase